MSVLTSLAKARASHLGEALPITTVRHLHVSDHPLVFVPLTMAGEANAPLAAMIGTDRDAPQTLVVAQPRNRDQRFEFAHLMARELLRYISGFTTRTERIPGGSDAYPRYRYADAPQLWVPNRAGIQFVRLFGRSTRLRWTHGPHAVPLNVPDMGRWLTFFAEQAEHAGSSLLVAATDALAMHWATGQSAYEDANLAAIMGWIDPPPGMTPVEAAAAAEDAIAWPPAGPATDPTFDAEVLAPTIAEHRAAAGDPAAQQRASVKLHAALRGQMQPTWELMWRAIARLKKIPPGPHVRTRWNTDKADYTRYDERIRNGRATQAKRDSAVAAARRLSDLERLQTIYEAQRAFDDPLVMAEARLSGEAFLGTVTAAEANRRVGRALRPLITATTTDPVRLAAGDSGLRDQNRPTQTAAVIAATPEPAGTRLVLELARGMGNGRTPAAGTVPGVGDEVCYSLHAADYQPAGTFPTRENTPWTHGGPPPEYVPVADDANEEWE